MSALGPAEEAESLAYLESLLGRTLRISIPDGELPFQALSPLPCRFFTGSFRCIDSDSNIILSNAFEHRLPYASTSEEAISAAATLQQQGPDPSGRDDPSGGTAKGKGKGTVDLRSRFMGLIVVPGHLVQKIEVEERMGVGVSAMERVSVAGAEARQMQGLPLRTKESGAEESHAKAID